MTLLQSFCGNRGLTFNLGLTKVVYFMRACCTALTFAGTFFFKCRHLGSVAHQSNSYLCSEQPAR